jgi:hypothetical protein
LVVPKPTHPVYTSLVQQGGFKKFLFGPFAQRDITLRVLQTILASAKDHAPPKDDTVSPPQRTKHEAEKSMRKTSRRNKGLQNKDAKVKWTLGANV